MILITGGTGFVGAHLLFKLVQKDHSVRAIYRKERKLEVAKRIFSYYTKDVANLFSKIEWVQGDLNDIPSLEAAFNGVTHVYHCAAFVSFEPNKFELLRRTNIEGTANIVNLCVANAIKKLCYISSVAAIGAPKKDKKTTETIPWNSEAENNVYGISKYGAELEVWRGMQEGVDAVIVNPGVILGPGIWRYGSGHIFKRVYSGLRYYPSGSVGYVSVNDVAESMIKLMMSPIVNERFILVAENKSYKSLITDIANLLQVKAPTKLASPSLLNIAWRADWLKHKITGKRRVLSKNLAKTLSTNSIYDNSKITEMLNYEFTPIHDILTSTVNQFLKEYKA